MTQGTEDMEMWYGKKQIGRISDAFEADGTWHGMFEQTIREESDTDRRIIAYIRFSEDWHDRIANDPSTAPDASAFDAHADVVHSGSWLIRTRDGRAEEIDVAPVFLGGGEVSWRQKRRAP
jgi:hypothetical protein